MVEDQYVCENVDVEGEHDYDSIVSAIIMERYDANKRVAIFANLEMARDMASELDEGKRAEYLKEYTDYQSYRIKAKEIALNVLAPVVTIAISKYRVPEVKASSLRYSMPLAHSDCRRIQPCSPFFPGSPLVPSIPFLAFLRINICPCASIPDYCNY